MQLRIFCRNNIPAFDLLPVEGVDTLAALPRDQPKLAMKFIQDRGIKFPGEKGLNFDGSKTYGRLAGKVYKRVFGFIVS
jgi:hypothetical protein